MSSRLQRALQNQASSITNNPISSVPSNNQGISTSAFIVNNAISSSLATSTYLPADTTQYIEALQAIGTPEYIKSELPSDLAILNQLSPLLKINTQMTISSNVVCEKSLNVKEKLRSNFIDSFNETEVSFLHGATMDTLRVSHILKPAGAVNSDIQIGGVTVSNQTIHANEIKHTNNEPLHINGLSIHGGKIDACSEITNDSDITMNGIIVQKGGSIKVHKIEGHASTINVMNTTFEDNKLTLNNIHTNTISEKVRNQGVTIENVLIKDGTINGMTFQENGLRLDTMETSVIKGINNKVKIQGDIELDNAKFESGSENGFQIDDVIFKNGSIYANNIYHTSDMNKESSSSGLVIGGVSLHNKEVQAENARFTLSHIQEVRTRLINPVDTNGVNVNGIVVKDNKLILPSISGDSSELSLYNQNGQIKLEAPDGTVYIPPSVSNWMDWVIQNNDQFVSVTSNTTRFTIIDQSVWVNINIQVTTMNDIPENYDTVWISLPEGYKSTRNTFQTFCTIENTSSHHIDIGKVYINGIVNDNIVYFEFNENILSPSQSYTIHANMVYEYEAVSLIHEITPWQSWPLRKKDTQIKSISINNARYYRIGSNVWLNIDIDMIISNITGSKTHAYVSLPPNVHAKNVYFTNPALIEGVDEDVIGNLSIGVSSQDAKLGTSILRITHPYGFESNGRYTIKGQIIFEEANASGLNFFFEHVDYNFGVLDNGNYGLMNTEDIAIEFIHNIDDSTITNLEWLSYFMKDSFNIHISQNDGFSLYNQMVIQPYRNVSRIENPWRVVKSNSDIHLQFTVDGKSYQNQFSLCFDEEDPY